MTAVWPKEIFGTMLARLGHGERTWYIQGSGKPLTNLTALIEDIEDIKSGAQLMPAILWSQVKRSKRVSFWEDGQSVRIDVLGGAAVADTGFWDGTHVVHIRGSAIRYGEGRIGVVCGNRAAVMDANCTQGDECWVGALSQRLGLYCGGFDHVLNSNRWKRTYGRIQGEVLSMTISFDEGKGSAAFAIDGHHFDTVFTDLEPPIYPVVYTCNRNDEVGKTYTIGFAGGVPDA